MADTTNKIFTKVELDSTQAQIEIAKLNAKASDTTKSLEERISAKNKEVKIQEELSKKNIASLEKEVKSLKKMGASEKEVERATAKLNREKIKATKVSERNTKQNNKLSASLAKSKKATGGLGGMFSKLGGAITSTIPALRGFKLALISTGVGAFIVAFGAAISLMVKAVKKGAEFSKSLSGLKAVINGTNEDMARLSGQAKELGASTLFTAGQVVGLQTELAKLGFSVTEIENSTPAILDLSTALSVDLAEAAEFTGNVVRSFGLKTSETRRVVDVLAKSASSSALDFSALRESFKLAAPTARALGMSIEETAGLLGVLADSGLKGSIAGTGLSKTLIMLRKKGLTLKEGLDKVSNSSDGLVTAIDLVGVIGAKTLQTLAANAPQIDVLNEKLANTKDGAQGAAAEMARIKADNLTGDITLLSSAWDGFLLGLEDGSGALNDIARDGVQFLTKSIGFLGKAFDVAGFLINDFWVRTKLSFSAGSDFLGGSLKLLGGTISKFTNEALLAFSKIPLLGKAIDEDAVRARIASANALVNEGREQLLEGARKYVKANQLSATTAARFAESQAQKKASAIARIEKEANDKRFEEQKKVDEKAQEQRKKDLEAIKKIEEDFKLKQQDLEDATKIEKLERKRERQLAEIEELKLSTAEKREAIKEVNAFYDEAERLAQEEADEKKRVKDEAQAEKDLAARSKKAQEDYDRVQGEIDQEQRLADEKRKIQDSYIGYIGQLGGILSSLAGKNKILATSALLLEKGSAIAGVVMKSIAAIAETKFNTTREVGQYSANAAATSLINPVASAVFGKMAIASAALGAKRIASTKVGAALSIASIGATTLSSLKGGGSTGSNPSGQVPQGSVNLDTQTQNVNDLSANNASRVGTNSSLSDNATASAVRNQTASGGQSHVAFYEGTYQEFRRGIDFRDGHSTIGG